jgi:hypothetical protein
MSRMMLAERADADDGRSGFLVFGLWFLSIHNNMIVKAT